MPDDVRAAVLRAYNHGHEKCRRCDGLDFSLVKRQKSNGSWTVQIQCRECGASTCQPLPLRDHPRWQSYPMWDESISDAYQERRQLAQEDARENRRREYDDWLLRSEEWAALRMRVLVRAGAICEACLSARAVEVHHETYDLGRLPPAWLLRAVCAECHARLHDRWAADDGDG